MDEKEAIKLIDEAIDNAFIEKKSSTGKITVSCNLFMLEPLWIFRGNYNEYEKLIEKSKETKSELGLKHDSLEDLKYTAMLHDKQYSAIHKELAEYRLRLFSKKVSFTKPPTIVAFDPANGFGFFDKILEKELRDEIASLKKELGELKNETSEDV